MKKTITLLALLVTVASAHHMAVYDDAGSNIDGDSPHLDMEF